MQNIEGFNELVGWMLAKVFEVHPRYASLDPAEIPASLRTKIRAVSGEGDDGFNQFWYRTGTWLEREGFLILHAKSLGTVIFREAELALAGWLLKEVRKKLSQGNVSN